MAIPDDPRRIVEHVARESYGRLIAFLSARTGDVAAAEDALADAFVTALHNWPHDGVPVKPEAWLLTAARRRLIDRARHDRVRVEAAPTIRLLMRTDSITRSGTIDDDAFPDERLKLLFVCAHPEIDRGMHTPLMLQVVLGLDAATIASAFLTSPATMGQRLSRAKARIRDAGIAFEIPDRGELPVRLDAVLDAIYAAYGSGWDDVCGSDPRRAGLAQEAVWLARTLLRVAARRAGDAGPAGADALLRGAAAGATHRDGDYVPMSEQDVRLWSAPHARTKRNASCAAAAGSGVPAASSSKPRCSPRTSKARGAAASTGARSRVLYEGLVRESPTVGAFVGRAAAIAEAESPAAGLSRRWIGIDPSPTKSYQPTGPCARTCCTAPDAWPKRSRPSIARSV